MALLALYLILFQPEPVANELVMFILTAAAGALGTICLMAWKGINRKIDKMMAYQHNSMMLTFKLLTRLHPGQAVELNRAMQEYMVIKPTDAASPMAKSARMGGY